MNNNNAPEKFKELLEIVSKLRSPDGCPWDKKQTPKSMKPYLLEESHELAEAIDNDNPEHVKEELGDLFFQLSLICQMYKENGIFSASDSLQVIIDKMIRRHPHVFEDTIFSSDEELKRNWLDIKAGEKKESAGSLDVPKSLPALLRAQRVIHRAAASGFQLHDNSTIMSGISQKINVLTTAVAEENSSEVSRLIGETLFMMVELGRLFEIYYEDTLHDNTTLFVNKYLAMEKLIQKETGKKVSETDSRTQEQYWKQFQENI
ncbi:MAG: nucleoside triphosphate pyrophosphohydrolase [Desulfobulbaceae bacterium]|uniref:Nucleoside triphosphate pyrophosphohydrolase n=1 Tax=Candidatus Desulfobia pelagia TaxID=2841692 RepID=A0A8J6TEK9_9BACT|nr:nucleoside triphosphate pyrophosphohydrolase [Candidatus Desulfobia pelagia]